MTAEQLALDCDPSWSADWQPSDRTPTRFDLRQAEIRDMRDQGPDHEPCGPPRTFRPATTSERTPT